MYLTAGSVVQRAGGEASQITEVLKEVEAGHADCFGFQLRHLQKQTHPSGSVQNSNYQTQLDRAQTCSKAISEHFVVCHVVSRLGRLHLEEVHKCKLETSYFPKLKKSKQKEQITFYNRFVKSRSAS